MKSETRLVALRSWISYTAAHSCNKHLREGGAGRPGLDAATDLCDLQPAVQAAGEEGGGEKEKVKASPFRSGHTDLSPRVMAERSAKRTGTVTGSVH